MKRKQELRYFLRLPDGTFSKAVETLEEMQQAMAETGRFGTIWAGMLMPYKQTKVVFEDVEEIEDTGVDKTKSLKAGTNGTLPPKVRRAKRTPKTDKKQGSSSVLPVNGEARKE